jgi:hypothetical protein
MLKNYLRDLVLLILVCGFTIIFPLPLYMASTTGQIIQTSLLGTKRRV